MDAGIGGRAVGVHWLNQESRGIFSQDKPKSQKLGRASLKQFAIFGGLPYPKI